MPADGIVQPNHPVQMSPRELDEFSTRLALRAKRKSTQNEMAIQTSQTNIKTTVNQGTDTNMGEEENEGEEPLPFEIIRNDKEQMLNFTDNASEGTNRMSAIKLKQSKLSGAHTGDNIHAANTSQRVLQDTGQVTFE